MDEQITSDAVYATSVSTLITADNSFLDPQCSRWTLDSYIIRRSILTAIKSHLHLIRGLVLDIGCGEMPYKPIILAPPSNATQYIGLDLSGNPYGQPDVEWDGLKIPLRSNSVDWALATEVLEHCAAPELVMCEALRVLKPGGVFFFTIPFLWPLHCVPHDEYRYTPYALERHLRSAGFEAIKLQSLGGWNKSLAQMLGLWVRRSPISRVKRYLLSQLFLPIVRYMAEHDNPRHDFGDHAMFIGVSGTAVKPLNDH